LCIKAKIRNFALEKEKNALTCGLSDFPRKNAYGGGSLFVCLQVGFTEGNENEKETTD